MKDRDDVGVEGGADVLVGGEIEDASTRLDLGWEALIDVGDLLECGSPVELFCRDYNG